MTRFLRFPMGCAFALGSTALAQPIDFDTQIRPILNQNCVACHGGVKSASDISFVYRDVTTRVGKKSGKRVIVPGKPEESELIARITSTDKEYRMPPADHGAALSADKIALLRAWIKQGAPWQDHWAFVPPKPQSVPTTRTPAFAKWAHTPIDRFVAARLEREKITPAGEATRAALLRRASLDLTGLPPTPEEITAFTSDKDANAYEKQIDRLLASPHFGERWASLWLDLARYADTKGYEKDDNRNVWQYRDWLIGAFNRNQPYDQFIIDQLAGDLLPNATVDQHIATAFHRLTQVNDEGGSDDEEYRIAAVIDRVATTWQVTNALTFNCVQCHSHPYDPIRHQEFYRFYAFFNGQRDADFRDEQPTLHVPNDRARYDDAWQLRREIEALRHDVVAAGATLEADAAQWRPTAIFAARGMPDANLNIGDGNLEVDGTIAANVRYELSLPVFSLSGEPITALRFEARAMNPEKAIHTPERGFIVTQIEVALSGPDGSVTPIKVGRFFPDSENLTTPATKTLPKPAAASSPVAEVSTPAAANPAGEIPAPPPTNPAGGTPALVQTNSAGGTAALPERAPTGDAPGDRKVAKQPPAKKAGKRGATKAGAGKAAATKAGTMPAVPDEVRDITLDFHFAANPTISGARWVVAALREPLVAPPGSTLRISVQHARQITEKPAPTRRLRVATSSDPRWNTLARDPEIARKSERVTEAIAELAKIPGTDLPIMTEMLPLERRETRVFARGNFLEKIGAPLSPGVPQLFPPLPDNAPANRLTLAKWFFQPGQPLTARVAVNRFWEQLFGVGIVATLEDFGSVGERPSHPELLDWLALHFERDLRWDIKALLREIVTSATYRQDGRVRPELLERDPQNRLLAHGPRQRLTAEMVRDQALAASGRLSGKMGGAPVMPPQPAGVWQTVYNSKDWVVSEGEDRYRRAVYTFWKRSAAYPGFLSFDMPARDLCTARRTPTNTPLQALVTLNDVVYQEAADALAERVQRETSDTPAPEARIARAFELVISRAPSATETKRLRQLYDESLAAATSLAAAKPQEKLAPETRALSDVASAIINLDAAFVR